MLQLIFGLSGTGKTTFLLEQIKARATQGHRSLFFVPEQFTSTAETLLYTHLGDRLSAYAAAYSFTSYAEACLARYGGVAIETLTDAGRVVLVRRAMNSLGNSLETYHRHRRNTGFCTMCAEAIRELKVAGATPETLLNAGEKLEHGGQKLQELGLIFAAYENLLQGAAMDTVDRVTRAAACLPAKDLADTAIFIDNFDGFTAPQYAMLRVLVCAAECTAAFCADGMADHAEGFGTFSPVQHAASRLRRLAAGQGIGIARPIVLEQFLRHSVRADLAALNALLAFDNLPTNTSFTAPAENITFTRAQNRYAECKTVACQIALLAAEGVRYHDMAIICRTLDAYEAPLRYELGLANVPYFTDENTTLEYTSLAAFFRAALALVAGGISTEPLLRLLKTDLCGYSATEIAVLENYAYTWQPKAAAWRTPFTQNPAGFGSQMRPEDSEQLAVAESVRSSVMQKLEPFVASVREADAAGIARALYALLQSFSVEMHLVAAAEQLRQHDEFAAEALYRTWNTFMELLTEMETLLGTDEVSAAEYDELLLLLLRSTDLGHVPQTQNEVMVTTADRMRLLGPKHCFVLGLNEGEFPKTVGFSGLLTHTDREFLVTQGVEMPGSFENRTLLEQMFFYRALTAATQTLHLSALADTAGAPVCGALQNALNVLQPPPLMHSLAQQAPTPAAALDLLGAQYRTDTADIAALQAALAQTTLRPSLAAMEAAAQQRVFQAKNKAGLQQLLGRQMRLSPTRIEQYYQCGFGYFLQYVLGIRPRRKAELSPLETGTLIHYVLEHVLRTAGDGFAVLPLADLTLLVEELTDAYVAENMPDNGRRFAYLIARLKEGAVRLLCYLQAEQQQSSFHPVAFEQQIGTREGQVPPITLHLPDGNSVQIIGTVDRVDTMPRERVTYVRVVDYKTGNKEFRPEEVYCGLNTQMLFYLFTLCDAGAGVPAGVLYLTGDPAPKSASRAEAEKPMQYTVDGLVLDDMAVLHGMDKNTDGTFVPVSFTKNGVRASNKLATPEELRVMQKHLETLTLDMAQNLYSGNIEAMPLCAHGKTPCAYCDYRAVCCHTDGRGERAVNVPKDIFRKMAQQQTTMDAEEVQP